MKAAKKIIDTLVNEVRDNSDLPNGWVYATLDDLVGDDGIYIDGDWVESKDQDPNGGVRLVQLADIGDGVYKDKSARFLTKERAEALNCTFMEKGDVLIARMPDPLGRACIFPGDEKEAVTVVDVCVFRTSRKDVDHKWLMYWINTPRIRSDISALQSGSTRKRISRGNLSKITFPFPPYDQQKRIVAKIEELFSHIDAGIDALKQSKKLLKQYRQSVLKAAVTGELSKEWREQNKDKLEPASKLLERILQERRQKWEAQQLEQFKAKGKVPKDEGWKDKYKEPSAPDTSDLPELPEGWCWVSPEQISSTDDYALAIGPFGSNLKVSDYRDEGVPLIFVRNIRRNSYENDTAKFVSPEKALELAAHSVDGGDILITKMGDPPGDASLYPIGYQRAIITADCIKWRLSQFIENIKLYVYFANSEFVRRQVLERTKGVAQKKISLDRFRSVSFPLCTKAEMDYVLAVIESKVSSIDAMEISIDSELQRSERLKQSVLQSAFGGILN